MENLKMNKKIIFILCMQILLFPIYVFAQSEEPTPKPVESSDAKPEETKPEETTTETKPKGFSKGKINLEFKGGQGTNSSFNSSVGKTRSEIDEFLFEYGITDNIGIGFSVHHQKYIHKSEVLEANKIHDILDNLYTLSLMGSSGGLSNYLLLSNLSDSMNKKTTLIYHSTSIDFAGSYHFLTGKAFDPFVRGYGGVGSIGGENLRAVSFIHVGIGGGARYYFTSWLFAIAEINTNLYSTYGVGTGSFNETNGQLGLGLSF
jgi:hypothetical protein